MLSNALQFYLITFDSTFIGDYNFIINQKKTDIIASWYERIKKIYTNSTQTQYFSIQISHVSFKNKFCLLSAY